MPILEISKTLIYEFWYDYVKPKYHIKTESFYKDIADDVKKRHDTSKYEVDKPLPKS